MSNGNGHRWSKFWWCDWQNDAALRMCSLGAQGYWMRALCIMHEAEPVGHLTVNGRVPTTRQLVAITGATEKEVTLYTHELEENGVFSRLPNGTIFCRRMVRDAVASNDGRKWGKKGGNPTLNPKQGGLTPPHNGEDKPNPLMEGDKLEAEAEAEAEPPRGPPVNRGGARRRNFRNAAHEIAREMDAERPITIDATLPPQVVDFLEFTGVRPKQAGGANG